jgi:hypothetical protein
MAFLLAGIKDWKTGLSCTLTALSALSDRTPTEIAKLLEKAAKKHGREIGPELRDDYNINDWLEVVDNLGGNWALSEDYSETPFKKRLTIDEWMAQHLGVEPELVFCDDDGKIGHVFATVEGEVVDTYTRGKRVKFSQVPDTFRFLRVKRTFLVE